MSVSYSFFNLHNGTLIMTDEEKSMKVLDMRGLEVYDATMKGYINKKDQALREQILSLMHEVNDLHNSLSVLQQKKNDRDRTDFKIVCGSLD